MHLVALAPAPTPVQDLVGDLLPKLPGLPDPSSPGWTLDDLLGPPAPGSLLAKADMAAVRGAQQLRTPELDEWARGMADEGATGVWFDMLARRDVGTVQKLKDKALLGAVIAANAGATQIAKQRYDRQRPYQVDPSIQPPVKLPHDSSYPSGHTSSAFAAARVIATLEPAFAEDAYDLARQVAASRVYAGVHFPTDVVAGALLGTGMADSTLRRVGFAPPAEHAAA